MIVIGTDGQYKKVDGTGTLLESDHPVYQAQIELNLRRGSWIGAPNAGHDIPLREKQSAGQIELFRKEIRFYLQKYSPEVIDQALQRSGVIEAVVIDEGIDG